MRLQLLFALVIAFLINMTTRADEQQSIALSEVHQAYAKSMKALSVFEVRWTEESQIPGRSRKLVFQGHFIRDQERHALEIEGAGYRRKEMFDGRFLWTLNWTTKTKVPQVIWKSEVKDLAELKPEMLDLFLGRTVSRNPKSTLTWYSFDRILNEGNQSPNIRVATDMVLATKCWKVSKDLEADLDGMNSPTSIEAWFDKSQGCMLRKLRCETKLPDRSIIDSFDVEEFLHIQGIDAEAWFPKRVRYDGGWAQSVTTFGNLLLTPLVNEETFKWNIPLDAIVVDMSNADEVARVRLLIRNAPD